MLFRLFMARKAKEDQLQLTSVIHNQTVPPMSRRWNVKTWIVGGLTSFVACPAGAQFTEEQEAAFGINAGRLAVDLNDLISAAIFTVILLTLALMSYAAYERWTTGQLRASAMSILLIRASLLLVIAGVFLR